ncbi:MULTISPECIES: DUF3017 domain-containing protein [unclassified Streptomyces]|uniref:DUF3017 domain-containing protein n=1 Tax=unclassified Streptomyces TaxID=2593676 RepID=UPI002DD96A56|nr:DUF3017 domain-containing protein [Streptomyces sp. NBC_01750]WSB00787.1 DUF3017 domain-containing protein [Streptomyces sp. NBC_01794]WSD34858.1 DUF3017 domain-containing protein [Streptomyces sp. NBC_01750]
MGVRTNDGADAAEPWGAGANPNGAGMRGDEVDTAAALRRASSAEDGTSRPDADGAGPQPAADAAAADSGPRPDIDAASPKPEAPDAAAAAVIANAVHPRHAGPDTSGPESSGPDTSGPDTTGPVADTASATGAADQGVRPDAGKKPSRRPPSLTRDTARPEGGGRAAPGDASAPARQWPLLTVLALAGLGLVIVGSDGFADAFRVGTILIGVALITGAVMRRTLPSVGMLAVRSRFTDMVTYGLLGTLIVLLALVAQPKPWLDVPFLEDAVHFTVR